MVFAFYMGLRPAPHPGPLPWGEGDFAQRVSEGWIGRSLEWVATARAVGLQE